MGRRGERKDESERESTWCPRIWAKASLHFKATQHAIQTLQTLTELDKGSEAPFGTFDLMVNDKTVTFYGNRSVVTNWVKTAKTIHESGFFFFHEKIHLTHTENLY